ncbi:uncharacterized protein LOC114260235 [Camellia sinensis]|uniref:uncharacterized protein LOC114260235 n=1 Tax=Camellia sinensis TaxID=4442 RepID=UPI0010359760|nr:uncharacterized protein LOC114260235 [Camellia sinensis]
MLIDDDVDDQKEWRRSGMNVCRLIMDLSGSTMDRDGSVIDLDESEMMSKIVNAFTSLGAILDPRVLSGRGPTSFTIHGELRHRTGSLQPQPGQDVSYGQLYIYDLDLALEIRNRGNPNLRRDVLKTIQDSLLQVNAFVATFRQAHAILHQLDAARHNLPAHLHYNSTTDRCRYNLPTADEIAIVIPGDGTEMDSSDENLLSHST